MYYSRCASERGEILSILLMNSVEKMPVYNIAMKVRKFVCEHLS